LTAFERRVVHLEPGARLECREPPWQDALVVVLAGELDVECAGGERHRFRSGDVLTLARLSLPCVRNTGATPTRLLAIRRKADR
jgi:quercetin dioxygenase-like cupin family protein